MNQAVTDELDEIYFRLDFLQEDENNRQEKRYQLNSGFIAFNSISFGKILNISQNGMAIYYLAQRHSEPHYPTEINLINSQNGFLLNEIPCRTAYINDKPTTGSQYVVRQIGLEFTDLLPEQEEAIAYLLDHYIIDLEQTILMQ